MATFDEAQQRLHLRVLLWGPEGAGKSRLTRVLRDLIPRHHRSDLLSQRELGLCDHITLHGELDNLRARFQLFAVPGMPHHRLARRAMLDGIDGLFFVAHAAREHQAQTQQSIDELGEAARVRGICLETLPSRVFFNDKGRVEDDAELSIIEGQALASECEWPHGLGARQVRGCVCEGTDARDCLFGLLAASWRRACNQLEIQQTSEVRGRHVAAALLDLEPPQHHRAASQGLA